MITPKDKMFPRYFQCLYSKIPLVQQIFIEFFLWLDVLVDTMATTVKNIYCLCSQGIPYPMGKGMGVNKVRR